MSVAIAHAYEKAFVAELFEGLAVELVWLENGDPALYRNAEGNHDEAELEVFSVTLPTAEAAEKMATHLRDQLERIRKPDSNTAFIRSAYYAEINNQLFTFAQMNVGFVYNHPETKDETATE